MRNCRKKLSIILSLMICLSVVSTSALAEGANETQTASEAVFEVPSAEEMIIMTDDLPSDEVDQEDKLEKTDTATNGLISEEMCVISQEVDQSPVGAVETIEGTDLGEVHITGWVYDPVDLSNNRIVLSISIGLPWVTYTAYTNGIERTDIDQQYGGIGKYHGFDITVPIEERGQINFQVTAEVEGTQRSALIYDGTCDDSYEGISYQGRAYILIYARYARSISLDKTVLPLAKGAEEQLTVSYTPVDAARKSITWSSSNPEVATVSSDGTVTAEREGNATITATAEGSNATATCEVSVTDSAVAVTSVKLNKNMALLPIGKTEKLTATVLPLDATDQSITWSSSSSAVATVTEGTVIVYAVGKTEIIAQTSNGIKDTCIVRVPFTDVEDPSAYYFNPVYWAFDHGVTSGTGLYTFSPSKDCTRGQIVTFLWKAMGSPEPNSMDNPFTDVKMTDYFYKPVLWAKENGITSGKTATTFEPGAPCTRGQIVTFLWKAMGSPEPGMTDNPFTDVKTSDYFYKPVLWAKENGVTSGTGAATFSPGKTCTRGQAMTFLWIANGSPDT